MKHLVIGAGATFFEALALGNKREACPPLMSDFAQKMWANYSPCPLLEHYLQSLGHSELGDDPRQLFYRLERAHQTNVERFMEFAWVNRRIKIESTNKSVPPGYITGLRIRQPGSSNEDDTALDEHGEYWENLLYHGVGSPLGLLMIQCFFENRVGWKKLRQSQMMISYLDSVDAVLNLNYDTVFELALEQLARPFCYSPNKPSGREILVAKPHGSLNMVMNNSGFTFGQPSWLGMPQPPGYRSFSGIIPPRLNKSCAQHPAAAMIIEPLNNRRPDHVIMWGVGLTESDVDLVSLYRAWMESANTIDVINPSAKVAEKVADICDTHVSHFSALDDWVESQQD